jgi:hypothetical protein|tara:strand:- start:1739 stop:2041 length:303 start_codon:yes stop_codon:yes gene_type:complete
MPPDWLREVDGDSILDIYVQASANKTEICGIEPWRERLKISVTARPRGGEANREVLQALAEWTGKRVSELSIVSGHSIRRKSVRIEGIRPGRISTLLEDQ